MKIKKIVLWLLTASMLISMAACGGGGNSGNGETSASGSSGKVVSEGGSSGDEVPEITFYMPGAPQKDTELVWEKINEILIPKIGAKVKFIQFDWGEYEEKMNLMINGGDTFDICFTAASLNKYLPNVLKGAYVPLDDLLAEHGQGIVENIDPAFLEGAKVDGVLYAIPVNKEIGMQHVININVDKATEAGIDYNAMAGVRRVQDLEPYLAQAKEFYADVPEFVPLYVDGFNLASATVPYVDIADRFGIYLDRDDPSGGGDEILYLDEMPEMIDFMKTMQKYWKAGYMRADQITNQWDTASVDASGQWFMQVYMYSPLYEITDSIVKGYPVEVIKHQKPITTTLSATGSMHAISVTSKHQAEAMKFLNELNSNPEVRLPASYGIAGTHYEEVGDKIQPIGDSGYSVPNFALGNFFILPLIEGEPDNKWEVFRQFNNESIDAPCLGFNFDETPVLNELTGLRNVQTEYNVGLVNGAVDFDTEYPKYIEKAKAAGLDVVKAEMQRQYDEWRASK